MVAFLAAPTFLRLALPSTKLPSMNKPTTWCRGTSRSLNSDGNKPNFTSASSLQLKVNTQAHLNNNGTAAAGLATPTESMKNGEKITSSPSEQIIKQLSVWHKILSMITTVIANAAADWTLSNWKPRQSDMIVDTTSGRLVEGGLVFRQNFSIRSFEIDNNFKISIGALMNYLQETALNHFRTVGLIADGFGLTAEMKNKDLVWVACWMQIVVDHYPSWDDVVQVDTWTYESGKNGLGHNWLVSDFKTGKTLIRATSVYVMMNKRTRKLSKFPMETREELLPYLVNCDPIIDKNSRKTLQIGIDTANCVCTGLTPRWSDLDINQHVSHAKYIDYVLESAPPPVMESHELSTITLEFRKECYKNSVLQSLSTVVGNTAHDSIHNGGIELEHLLRLESGSEIVRGRTTWKPKYANKKNADTTLAESA